MTSAHVHQLGTSKRTCDIGIKAEHLHWLIRQGQKVPLTYVLPYDVYEFYRRDRKRLLDDLGSEITSVLDMSIDYAVRSSANAEDSKTHSFAGQFKSILHVSGLDAILDAVEEVFQAVETPKIQTYLEKVNFAPDDLKMAVILQEMVTPVTSGVAFSKNPMTGLNEIVIEAVEGSGEALLQGGVTPNRWVHKWGNWIARPEKTEIDESILEEVAQETKQIAKAYGSAVDLEWVFDGENVYWVQLREITGLEGVPVYSNRISREYLPGVIKPLVWSVNVPLVNSAWIQLFTELIGPNDIDPYSLAKAFHYHAYFNMGTVGRIFEVLGFPYDSLELLMGYKGEQKRPPFRPTVKTLRHIPRMLRFIIRSMRFDRQVEARLPEFEVEHREIAEIDFAQMDEAAILNTFDELYELNLRTAYVNIVVPLLMSTYNAIFKKQLKGAGFDYEQFNLMDGMERLEKYDPNISLKELNMQFKALAPDIRSAIASGDYESFLQLTGIESFQESVKAFMQQFGHLSESGNDFSKTPWRETGDLILQMITDYKPPVQSSKRLAWENLALNAIRRFQMRPMYQRARQFCFYREAISSQYTFGFGLFRTTFLALGERFVLRELLVEPEDIFYLYLDEIRGLVASGESAEPMNHLIQHRKEEMQACEGVSLPEVIYGDEEPPLEISKGNGKKLSGIPSARGYYQGAANVIQQVSAFNKMRQGDVLVIPYSDVAWTPLFAKAGAVIAESGGILSHSSIVAREYGIPCVVSVPSACKLRDGALIKVDGYRGEITLLEEA
jgi:phosphohistidine swiveling domain-containing protein